MFLRFHWSTRPGLVEFYKNIEFIELRMFPRHMLNKKVCKCIMLENMCLKEYFQAFVI